MSHLDHHPRFFSSLQLTQDQKNHLTLIHNSTPLSDEIVFKMEIRILISLLYDALLPQYLHLMVKNQLSTSTQAKGSVYIDVTAAILRCPPLYKRLMQLASCEKVANWDMTFNAYISTQLTELVRRRLSLLEVPFFLTIPFFNEQAQYDIKTLEYDESHQIYVDSQSTFQTFLDSLATYTSSNEYRLIPDQFKCPNDFKIQNLFYPRSDFYHRDFESFPQDQFNQINMQLFHNIHNNSPASPLIPSILPTRANGTPVGKLSEWTHARYVAQLLSPDMIQEYINNIKISLLTFAVTDEKKYKDDPILFKEMLDLCEDGKFTPGNVPSIRLLNVPSEPLYKHILASYQSRKKVNNNGIRSMADTYMMEFRPDEHWKHLAFWQLDPYLRRTSQAHYNFLINPLSRMDLGGDGYSVKQLNTHRIGQILTVKGTVTHIKSKNVFDSFRKFRCCTCKTEFNISRDLTHKDVFILPQRCSSMVGLPDGTGTRAPSRGIALPVDSDIQNNPQSNQTQGRNQLNQNNPQSRDRSRPNYNNWRSGYSSRPLGPYACKSTRFEPSPHINLVAHDAQSISLTDSSFVGASGIPSTLNVLLLDDLCSSVSVGDDVIVVGQLNYYWNRFQQDGRTDVDVRFFANNITVTRSSTSSHQINTNLSTQALSQNFALKLSNTSDATLRLMQYDIITTRVVYTLLRTYHQWPLLLRSLLVHSVSPTLVGMHRSVLSMLSMVLGKLLLLLL